MTERVLLSIFVGAPQRCEAADGTVFRTSMYKNPVCETIWLGSENLEGNVQANLKYHGGPDKAVCCFASEHLPHLSELTATALPHGALGENFTLRGMLEDEVCLGDRYRVGDAIVEVSQPRQPCANLSKRWGDKQLPKLMVQHGYTGWYMRVIEEGLLQPGDPVELLDRPHPHWTITALNRLMFVDKKNRDALIEVTSLPQLSDDWRADFLQRLQVLA
jgi:MOSC domain-containing protein YiiM